jgi:signal transduction histidine kinase
MTTRVLVIEDNRADARLLKELLAEVPGRPFVLTLAETLADGIAHAESSDVILLDLSLPDAHGRETVERMVAAGRSRPIVVLTGNDDEEAAIDALKAGAQDYLLKMEMSASTVARSIKYAIERKRAEAAELARTKSDEAAEHARFVADALREVTRALDLNSALARLAKALLPRLGDLCIVDLLQEDGAMRPVGFAGMCLKHDDLGGAEGTRRVEAVVARRKTTAFTALDESSLDDRHRALATRFRAHSFLISPLIARDRVIGTISLAYCRQGMSFGADELLLADEVASHAALAIDNARLYEQARKAVQGRDELLSIVSHDLRNPLNVMSLALKVIDHGGDAQRAVNCDRIRRALDRMQRLIDDLLDVARVDSGTLELDLEPVDVGGILEDAMVLFSPIAAEKKILLVRDYDPAAGALGQARVDGARIAQVLSNLLGNALKFTPAGGTIHLGARSFDADRIRIEVRDTGPGIGAEHLPHVFDRFWQCERRKGGVGLGLTIAKGIVDAHGGTIHVESTPGMGACFWFTVERCGEPASVVDTKIAL